MGYFENLKERVNVYYEDILPAYKVVTTEAMEAFRSRGLFKKKKDLEPHIDAFYDIKHRVEEFNTEFDTPGDETKIREMEDQLKESINGFLRLIEKSINFYENQNKLDKKRGDITMQDVSLTYNFMQAAMVEAAEKLETFDRAYQTYQDPSKAKEFEELDARREAFIKEQKEKQNKGSKSKRREKGETL